MGGPNFHAFCAMGGETSHIGVETSHIGGETSSVGAKRLTGDETSLTGHVVTATKRLEDGCEAAMVRNVKGSCFPADCFIDLFILHLNLQIICF